MRYKNNNKSHPAQKKSLVNIENSNPLAKKIIDKIHESSRNFIIHNAQLSNKNLTDADFSQINSFTWCIVDEMIYTYFNSSTISNENFLKEFCQKHNLELQHFKFLNKFVYILPISSCQELVWLQPQLALYRKASRNYYQDFLISGDFLQQIFDHNAQAVHTTLIKTSFKVIGDLSWYNENQFFFSIMSGIRAKKDEQILKKNASEKKIAIHTINLGSDDYIIWMIEDSFKQIFTWTQSHNSSNRTFDNPIDVDYQTAILSCQPDIIMIPTDNGVYNTNHTEDLIALETETQAPATTEIHQISNFDLSLFSSKQFNTFDIDYEESPNASDDFFKMSL